MPWAPTSDLRLSFALDGLGAVYGLLATGVGALVFAYGTCYLTSHLEHERRPASERWRFWPWIALFAVAMVGLATAQDGGWAAGLSSWVGPVAGDEVGVPAQQRPGGDEPRSAQMCGQ